MAHPARFELGLCLREGIALSSRPALGDTHLCIAKGIMMADATRMVFNIQRFKAKDVAVGEIEERKICDSHNQCVCVLIQVGAFGAVVFYGYTLARRCHKTVFLSY